MSTASSFELWNRASVVTVGNYQISNIGQQQGLDIWFEVKRSLKKGTPNTCDLRLYNLAPTTRSTIENYTQATLTAKGSKKKPGAKFSDGVVPVTIVAGYVGKMGLIFSGSLRSAQTSRDGADLVTELNSGDADEAIVLARTSYSFPRGANAYGVAQQLLTDMGAGQGNTSAVANTLKGSPLYALGVSLKGSSYDHLQDLARSCGLEVTMQNGVAQWSPLGMPTAGEQYSLSSSTGMYGSPTKDTKGRVAVESALIPDIVPGCNLQVSGELIGGWFRVTDMETTGSTFGAEWGHKMTASDYGIAP